MAKRSKRFFRPKRYPRKKPKLPHLKPGADVRLRKVFAEIGVPENPAFTPDAFQLDALAAIEDRDCLVTAPTGSGKTWIAENDTYRGDNLRRHEILEAEIKASLGESEAALQSLESFLAVQTYENPFLTAALAKAYTQAGQWDKAADMSLQLINMKWVSYEGLVPWIQAHYQLARAYEETGDKSQAVEFYEKFLSFWKDSDSRVAEVEDAGNRLTVLKEL